MKHFTVLLFFFSLLACQTQEEPQLETSTYSVQDSLTIVDILQKDWPKAYKDQDTSLIKEILSDNFQVIFDSGLWSDKRGEVDWISQNAISSDSLIRDIKRFEFLSHDVAIVAGTGHYYNEGQHSTYEFTDVFIKKEGDWKATASHVSGSKEVE